MRCPDCGEAPLPRGARYRAFFCESCGAELETPAQGTSSGPAKALLAVGAGVVMVAMGVVALGGGDDSSSDYFDPSAGSATESAAETDSTFPTLPPTTDATLTAAPTTASAVSSAREPSDMTTLNASDFSIEYPTGWNVEKQEVVPKGTNYRDTTIKRDITDPHYVVRVDVLPGGDPQTTVDQVVTDLRRKPGFREVSRRSGPFATPSGTFDAVTLEFLLNHPDSGIPMRTVDVFFRDGRGRSFAVLTRAPESDYSAYAAIFARVRSSVAPR